MWKWYEINARTSWAWDRLLDQVYPRTCIECGRLVTDHPCRYTCPDCRERYPFIVEPACACCGAPIPGKLASERICRDCRDEPRLFGSCRSLFLHRGIGARLVHTLKYSEGRYLYREIAALIAQKPEWGPWFTGKALVPVPLHPRKLRRRGYNQADLIVRGIREVYPHLIVAPFLTRTRMTPSQTFLSREARRKNMRNAFSCTTAPRKGQELLLIDDVLTTGATLNAAAQALRRAGRQGISAFTLAHG